MNVFVGDGVADDHHTATAILTGSTATAYRRRSAAVTVLALLLIETVFATGVECSRTATTNKHAGAGDVGAHTVTAAARANHRVWVSLNLLE